MPRTKKRTVEFVEDLLPPQVVCDVCEQVNDFWSPNIEPHQCELS